MGDHVRERRGIPDMHPAEVGEPQVGEVTRSGGVAHLSV